MAGLQQLLTAARYPRRAYVEVTGRLRKRFLGGNDGIHVLDEDWDNLIILDACRYDTFEEHNTIPGRLKRVTTRGMATGQFVQENFAGVTDPEVVYVSANPNPAKKDAEFAAVKEVWDDRWDEELQTVPPEAMVEATIEAEQRYPNKRIISHFLQPHYPWIGANGRKFMSEWGYRPGDQTDNVYLLMRRGEVSIERFRECYEENLVETMPHVESLVEVLNGKTVISSDHGESFGTMDVYGHAPHAYIPELEDVPWLEVPFDERKKITVATEMQELDASKVTKRKLRDLGYIE